MSEWREVTLAELAAPIPNALATGPFGSSISSKHFREEGVPVIRGSNLSVDVGVRLRDEGLVFLEEGLAQKFRRSVAGRGDLVFTCWGTIGQIGLIDQRSKFAEYVVSNKQMKLTPDPDKAESLFLYYALSSKEMLRSVQDQAIGAAVPGFNLGQLKQLRLRLPAIGVQQRVVGVLESLDELIENNRRRVEVLEEMARAIYREWFVHFRYPGREGAAVVESPIGPIPEGWEAKPLEHVSSLVRGRSYRKPELVESGGRPFINLKCMMRGGGFRRNGLKRYDGKYNDDQVVHHGDVVLAVTDLTQEREILARATLVPRLPEGTGIISLDVARVVPDDPNDRLWIFAALHWSNFAERVKEYANGSTVLHLSPRHVSEGLILWPDPQVRESYVKFLAPIVELLDDLNDASSRLAALRDKLLPRLVNGQIDVSSLDLGQIVGGAAS